MTLECGKGVIKERSLKMPHTGANWVKQILGEVCRDGHPRWAEETSQVGALPDGLSKHPFNPLSSPLSLKTEICV